MANKQKRAATDTTPWHSLEVEEVLEKLQTSSEKGLSDQEAESRLEKHGKNKLPEAKNKTALQRLLSHFNNVLIYLLIGAALITALMDEWTETIVILAVVIINVVIGFIQEGRAEKALESIKKMLSLEAGIIRDGKKRKLEAEKLVPGDIVLLRSGDKIPADVRIIRSKDFRVEESPLTGESEEVDKKPEKVEEKASLGDRSSMGFSGTTVTYGEATTVVVETGQNTQIGNITGMISEVEETKTPLMQKIDSFGKLLSVIIVVMAAVFFAVAWFFSGYQLQEAFLIAISIVVASIPEGLPAIMTITLAIGVRRMANRNAIIRRLPSVETLGAVSAICSDKTGTLTRNEMTAKNVTTANRLYFIEGSGYKPEGKILLEDEKEADISQDKAFQKMLQSMRLCNESHIVQKEGQWKLDGTPTEGALMALALKAGLKDLEENRLDFIPFSSDKKYSATLNKIGNKTYIFSNGAPERLLDMCSKQFREGKTEALDKEFWNEKMESLAEKGERVLASAYKEVDSSKKNLEEDDLKKELVFLGLTGIIDPPREGVVEAIQECKEAGIRVIMITGDHATTARAISGDLGIHEGREAVTGHELEEMNEDRLNEAVMNHNVFARTDPEHKLRLVGALQKNNILCAMTGDGVNDAPALKKSDIGIAMGIKGTEVSKEASEMVLADDNFATIVNAVEEGRTVYDNLKKTITFLLPANGSEALVIIIAVIFGMTLPISPVQILWINMVSAVTLALSLSVEPMEHKVMMQPPRPPGKPILDLYFVWKVIYVSILSAGFTLAAFIYSSNGNASLEEARTFAVNMLVSVHVFYLFNTRKLYDSSISRNFFDNPYIFLAIAVLIGLQLLLTYLPFMNQLFGTAPISLNMWLWTLAGGVVLFFLVELEKYIHGLMTKKKKPENNNSDQG